MTHFEYVQRTVEVVLPALIQAFPQADEDWLTERAFQLGESCLGQVKNRNYLLSSSELGLVVRNESISPVLRKTNGLSGKVSDPLKGAQK